MMRPASKRLAFVFINCFFLLPVVGQTGDSLLNQLSAKWKNVKAHTLELAALMPAENYDFKPVPEIMSFKEQLMHMSANMRWLSSSYLFAKSNSAKIDTAGMSKATVLKYMTQAFDDALAAHVNLTKSQLDEVVPFFAGPLSRRQILLLMHDHQTHHAGQLILYVRLKGIKPPAYVGW